MATAFAKRLKATGLKKYFNIIATTSEVGYEKPRKEVFEYALFTATEKPEGDVIAVWLELHSEKIRMAKPRGKKKKR